MTNNFNDIVATTEGLTVATSYTPVPREQKGTHYQSEAELERNFIEDLRLQGYEYISIRTEKDLIQNLRTQMARLNDHQFTDSEWTRFYQDVLANRNDTVIDKTRKFQDEKVFNLTLDDGTVKNIKIVDDKSLFNNHLQVINQYEVKAKRTTRFDVTILMNGLPIVHVELKRRGIPLRQAFNQINRYQRDSFWHSSRLFEYVQIFVISNGTDTKYYSNTVRKNQAEQKQSQQNFAFTSYWADEKNQIIPDLVDFTRTFFGKHALLNILTKYCVFNASDVLMVMRPYQIAAAERIINRVNYAYLNKEYGSIDAGGYIWHTTGSGKTLTSFQTAKLLRDYDTNIDKVVFVVDRQDLDYQTILEYNKFEEGSVSSTGSSRKLRNQLKDDSVKIIVTTIQKLSNVVKSKEELDVYNKHVVFLFDECHRSQFGAMHARIIERFNKYYLFGFTGTPIYPENTTSTHPLYKTTEQIFGDELHTYTIKNAIEDKNVLKFKLEYHNTIRYVNEDDDHNEEVEAIDEMEALMDDARIGNITDYIIANYKRKTKGFNSIFAVGSIPMAVKYYQAFKERDHNLKVASIFSFTPNEDVNDLAGLVDDTDTYNPDDRPDVFVQKDSRSYLEDIIDDYNEMFGVSYDVARSFGDYYKDVSRRMKNGEIDILIVVNMFLTGFDAPTLNTLWVDKFLRHHGLIQAFSRTNRIHDDTKTHGNIICFRNLENELSVALSMFSSEENSSIILIRPFDDYYYGFTDENDKLVKGYKDIVEQMMESYPLGERISGEQREKDFITLFGRFLKVLNIVEAFDEFTDDLKLLTERDIQDYKSIYVDLYDTFVRNTEKESIIDDIEFEMELVKRQDVGLDYIIKLIEDLGDSHTNEEELLKNINRHIDSNMMLLPKKALIKNFLMMVNNGETGVDWHTFYKKRMMQDINKLIDEMGENIKPLAARAFMLQCIERGEFSEEGQAFNNIIKARRFGSSGLSRAAAKRKFSDKFYPIVERYADM